MGSGGPMANVVELDRDGEVAIVTLNAPDRRNAVSLEARRLLLQALQECAGDPACRSIVLTGAGGHFCSGGEVKPTEGADSGPDPMRTRRNIGVLHDVVRLLAAGPKPTVAAVNGGAYGAGLSLAAACDHVVATPSARFCASFGKIGLIADAGLMWSLPNRVGMTAARNLLLTGRVISADEALRLGLVDEAAEESDLLTTAVRAAQGLSKLAPLAVAAMRHILANARSSLESVIAAETAMQPMLTLTEDYVEGRAAFKDRRPPRFRGL
jgi:2-(1,2-epoxy-1,2-dihydrophenyl)acetyl-CoA isomerase